MFSLMGAIAFGANVGEHVMAGYKFVLRMPAW